VLWWMDSIEEDLKTMGVRNWRRKLRNRDKWVTIVKETKFHNGLYGMKEETKRSKEPRLLLYCDQL
jgi:hypothetical protein